MKQLFFSFVLVSVFLDVNGEEQNKNSARNETCFFLIAMDKNLQHWLFPKILRHATPISHVLFPL